jgi:hypothetical protein
LAEDVSVFNRFQSFFMGFIMRLAAFAPRCTLLAFGLLVLAACSGPAAKTFTYDLPPTPGGRICANQCVEAKDYCKQDCSLDLRRCVGTIQAQALKDYDQYTRDQFAAHAAIELRPRDFERTGPCDNDFKSCSDDCEGHYQLCYQGCGGAVSTTTSCQFLCF